MSTNRFSHRTYLRLHHQQSQARVSWVQTEVPPKQTDNETKPGALTLDGRSCPPAPGGCRRGSGFIARRHDKSRNSRCASGSGSPKPKKPKGEAEDKNQTEPRCFVSAEEG